MKFKQTLIWSLLHDKPHPSLGREEQQIAAYMPILDALFPGINYYSISGFSSVVKQCGQPALKKLFPDLINKKEEEIKDDVLLEIKIPFLPSKGYEWTDSETWRRNFQKLLIA